MTAGSETQENQTRTIERLLAAAQVGGQVVVSGILGVVLYQIFGGDMAALALLSPAFARLVETVGGDLLAGWFERVASDKTLTAADIQKLFEKELKKHDLEATLKHDLEATLRQINLKYDLLSELPSRAMLQQIALALDERAADRAGELQRLLRQALERLEKALTRTEQAQAITAALQGSGGIGKTALAQALAARLAGHFGGGVFWADLPAANGDPLPPLAAWAGLCGQNAAGLAADGPGRAGQVRGLLAARQAAEGPLLLALDDVRPEWVDGARLLLQARPPGAALLLTTREETTALRLGATINSLDVLEDEAAAKLLLELAPDKLTPAAAAEIAQLCGCWPLALRLAGALAAAEGAEWLLPRLRDERRLGTLAYDAAASKEESVALAFDLSYARLAQTDGAAARAFRWLAAFAAAPVNAARLAAVLAWGELPESEQTRRLAELEEWGELDEGWAATAAQVEAAEEMLRRLRRAALLQTATAPATVDAPATAAAEWYALHPLLRDYAAAKLDAAGERAAAQQAHSGAHLAYARAHRAADPTAYDALEQTRADVLLALDRAYAAQAWAQVRRFAWALDNYLDMRGYWGEQRKRLVQAIEAAQAEGNKREEAAFAGNLATLFYQTGQMEKARAEFERVLDIFQQLGEKESVAVILHQLGILAQATGEMETAQQRYAESLTIERQLGNRAGIATTLHQLGVLAQDTGEMETARQRYAESLVIERELGAPFGIATTLGQLANLEDDEGNEAEAERLYREAITTARTVGNVADMSIHLFNLALLLEKQARLDEALPLLRQAVDIAERLRMPVAAGRRTALERVQQKLAAQRSNTA